MRHLTIIATALAALIAVTPALAELTDEQREILLDPDNEQNQRQAPERFQVLFHTSRGDFLVDVHRDWSPNGADRFYNLVSNKYYEGNRFFRVLPGFVVQWGLHGDPALSTTWNQVSIEDDKVVESNTKGRVTFATAGPNTRTMQLFVSLDDNSFLDEQGFSPFAEVVEGMDVIEALYSEYGERPNQGWIVQRGNDYLEQQFPDLDYIITTTVIVEDDADDDGGEAEASEDGDAGESESE